MEESRRRFLHHMTALSALGGASGTNAAGAQEPNRLSQAQQRNVSVGDGAPSPAARTPNSRTGDAPEPRQGRHTTGG